jgi:integrase
MFVGIREGELLGLQWQDLDFISRRITIARSIWRGKVQTPKTDASIRILGMPAPLMQILLEQRRQSSFTASDDFVFCQADGSPIDPDSLRTSGIYPALKRAGIPLQKRASGCHAFRHLVGSLIHKETGSLKLAQKQLGHANVSTTGDIYTHIDDADLDKNASVLGKAFAEICGRSVVGSNENVQ